MNIHIMLIKSVLIKSMFIMVLYSFSALSNNALQTLSWQEQLKQKIANATIPTWAQRQIDADLSSFTTGITKKMLAQAASYSTEVARFKIINDIVYSNIETKATLLGAGFSPGGRVPTTLTAGRKDSIHHALQDIISCVPLADIEFLVLLSDGVTDTVTNAGPFFAFSKNQQKNHSIILMPDPDVLKNHANLQKQTMAGAALYPWENKIKQAFWRGGTNDTYFYSPDTFQHSPRFKLVTYAHKNPAAIDALFADIAISCNDVQSWLNTHNYVGDYVSIADHIRYKYQIQIDGFTAAWARMYWQLFSNALMLKQESDNIQWYYHTLKPYVHYIPLSNDMSDIAEKIDWAEHNAVDVQQIIKNANTFARENLTYADMLYYLHTLLTHYAQLQHFTPTLD